MNHFALKDVALRYALGRPYFHPVVMDKIWQRLDLTLPLNRALDVGCGTGLSTLALTKIARQVVGVDPALAMLKMAVVDPAVNYLAARGEYLPLADHQFDLITVSSAFYWFERKPFFAEVDRLLQPAGWLVIYDNAFQGEMAGNPVFEKWVKEEFWKRYPYPATLNTSQPLEASEAARWGFNMEETRYHNVWKFSLPDLINYLLSLSNITAALENNEETAERIGQWLTDQLKPFFSQEYHEFGFGGPLIYLQLAQPEL